VKMARTITPLMLSLVTTSPIAYFAMQQSRFD
jgi:hypothetical protein